MPDLKPLTQEQRLAAREAAHDAITRAIGARPQREHYSGATISRYPANVTRLITVLAVVLLLAAFTPSAIRLYTIGSETFGAAINNTAAMRLAGLATVLSAETGQVVFSLALATLGVTPAARRLLYTSMFLSTGVALVGNIQVALPGHTHSPFAWLEAITPPLLVLSTAYVLKGQMLETIEQRHANEQAFQAALADWTTATARPEDHPRWQQFYANALADALRKANNRRKDEVAAMTRADWRAAVYREMQAEEWYAEPEPEPEPALVAQEEPQLEPETMSSIIIDTRHRSNGHHIPLAAAG